MWSDTARDSKDAVPLPFCEFKAEPVEHQLVFVLQNIIRASFLRCQ